MSRIRFDPPRSTEPPRRKASLSCGASMLLGALGFCGVSVLGFVPWAFLGRELQAVVGEAGMYGVCALVFVGAAGPVLHPLMGGRGSLGRFQRLFAVAFGAYSVAWIVGWMALGGHAGSVAGLLAGTAAMGWVLTRALDARSALLPVVLVLFVANSAGYFAGGWAMERLIDRGSGTSRVLGMDLSKRARTRVAMLSWGVFYGLGLGAGLGYALHRCRPRHNGFASPEGP